MIVCLEREEIDDDKWNRCIKDSHHPLVYAQTWYLDSVCEFWQGLVLNDYEAIMPLPGRSKLWFSYVFVPFWAQQLGVFSKGTIDEELIDAFIDKVPARYGYVALNLQASNPVSSEYKSVKRLNLILDIPKDRKTLYAKYKTQIKRNIKKAKENKLNILVEQNPEAIIKLFRENKGQELEEIRNADYDRLSTLLHAGIYHKQVAVWSVYDESNQLVAGAVCLLFGDRITLLLAASNDEGKELNAMSLLINNIIEESLGYLKLFDFEGSSIPGLERFYKGFGAREEWYRHVDINRLPKVLSWLK